MTGGRDTLIETTIAVEDLAAFPGPLGAGLLELPLRDAGFLLPTWDELVAFGTACRARRPKSPDGRLPCPGRMREPHSRNSLGASNPRELCQNTHRGSQLDWIGQGTHNTFVCNRRRQLSQ